MALLNTTGSAADDDRKLIPASFKIVARYGAGYSTWKSWRHTITGDGNVVKEVFSIKKTRILGDGNVVKNVFGLGTTKEETKLPEDDLRALIAKIEEADFFTLRKRYTHGVTDNPTLILTITLDRKAHEVMVYAPGFLRDDQEVKRFLKVWSEVLRKVPPPNSDQKPDLYLDKP
ncbi:MAG: hypothetical protein ABS79_03475 [Planctomycetes bacterium SCN 63-9]|nr:MAG: hypothetical protein ABS79_03475 [Planctomycetes bacterium SCN 63-9]